MTTNQSASLAVAQSLAHYRHSLWLAALLSGCAVGPQYVQPEVADIRLASPQAAQLTGDRRLEPPD